MTTFSSESMDARGAVHLWYARPDQIEDAELLERYWAALSFEERERTNRLRFPDDRRDRLVARMLVRAALSRLTDISPEAWRFAVNDRGQPEIEYPIHARSLRFSLSHTRGLVACISAWGRKVGVDAEQINRGRSLNDLAERYFTHREAAVLRDVPRSERDERVLEYWTLREAYLKARGLGLSVPLDRISFDLGRASMGKIRAAFEPEVGDDAEAWKFDLHRLTSEHVVATAVEHAGDSPPFVLPRELVPLVS